MPSLKSKLLQMSISLETASKASPEDLLQTAFASSGDRSIIKGCAYSHIGVFYFPDGFIRLTFLDLTVHKTLDGIADHVTYVGLALIVRGRDVLLAARKGVGA